MPKRTKTSRTKGSLKATNPHSGKTKPGGRPIKASSPRKAGKKRSHDFALTMREKISENWVKVKRIIDTRK